MKFFEKVQMLRKQAGLTQEDLALICKVSRQSVSKWEADLAYPETDKLMLLSNLFQTTIDVLLKDELSIGEIMEVNSCGKNAVIEKKVLLYEGALIKESIEDENLLDYLLVHKVELWNVGGCPKYWTVLFFTSAQPDLPELAAKALIADEKRGGNWFVDFKEGNTKYIVFRNRIFTYHIGDSSEKELVCEACRKLGVADNQMNWGE